MKLKKNKEDFEASVVCCDTCNAEISEIGNLRGNYNELLTGACLELSSLRTYNQQRYFCSNKCLYDWLKRKFRRKICRFCGEYECENSAHRDW